MKVTVTIATRGDVLIEPLLRNFPHDWEILVWDNGHGKLERWFWAEVLSAGERCDGWQHDMSVVQADVPNLGPHGRFAAIEWATHDLILTQDDDVIVSDPEWIASACYERMTRSPEYGGPLWRGVVCNMPQEFRPHYPDSAMVGFGAAFHRDAPEGAFTRFFDFHRNMRRTNTVFQRESCRIFTALTPRILVDVPKTDMPYASDPNRLWKDPKHVWYRGEALRLAREVRDAG